jgi:hypothetical protein
VVAELPKAFPKARVRTLHAKGGECSPPYLFYGYDRLATHAEGLLLVDVPALPTDEDPTHIDPFHGPITWLLYCLVPPAFCRQAVCSKHTSFSLRLLSLADLLGLYFWADAVDNAPIRMLSEPAVVQAKQCPTIHSVSPRPNHPCQSHLVSCLTERFEEVDAQLQAIRRRILSHKPFWGLLIQRFTRPDHTMLLRYSMRTLQRWRTHQHRRTETTVDHYKASRITALPECGSTHIECGCCARCVPNAYGAAQMKFIVHLRSVTDAIVIHLWTTIAIWSLGSRKHLSSLRRQSQPLIPEVATSQTACLQCIPRLIDLEILFASSRALTGLAQSRPCPIRDTPTRFLLPLTHRRAALARPSADVVDPVLLKHQLTVWRQTSNRSTNTPSLHQEIQIERISQCITAMFHTVWRVSALLDRNRTHARIFCASWVHGTAHRASGSPHNEPNPILAPHTIYNRQAPPHTIPAEPQSYWETQVERICLVHQCFFFG